jgi:cytochrome c-type biogenesis protein CcmH
MNTFLFIAACMAAIAAGAVAWPLLRNGSGRLIGAAAGVLVIVAAAGLYPLWSTFDWHAPASPTLQNPDVLAMVGKLEQRLREQPNDLKGWLMLGRSYLALERVDDAVSAYDHAHQLDANNVDAMIGLGEALSMRAGGDLSPPAAQLFEQAVKAAPDNPKALLYGGFAAMVRGDRALARSRWQALLGLHPPPELAAMLEQRMAELGPDTASVTGMATPGVATPGTNAAGADAPAAQATINLSIDPALKSRLTGAAQIFVFAREPGTQGPPLAAKRLTSAAIGTQIHLSSADSMMPGHGLAAGQHVSITARVSFSGQPLPSPGDLFGELTYDVGRDGVRDLIIDRVTQ